MINGLDVDYIEHLLDSSSTKGIDIAAKFNSEETELIEHYKVMRSLRSHKKLQMYFWEHLESFSGSIPPSCEGSKMVYFKNKIYHYGGLGRDVYGEMR